MASANTINTSSSISPGNGGIGRDILDGLSRARREKEEAAKPHGFATLAEPAAKILKNAVESGREAARIERERRQERIREEREKASDPSSPSKQDRVSVSISQEGIRAYEASVDASRDRARTVDRSREAARSRDELAVRKETFERASEKSSVKRTDGALALERRESLSRTEDRTVRDKSETSLREAGFSAPPVATAPAARPRVSDPEPAWDPAATSERPGRTLPREAAGQETAAAQPRERSRDVDLAAERAENSRREVEKTYVHEQSAPVGRGPSVNLFT